ncbi:LIP-domain-containing protein [Xylariaceae sp. FL0255]|nr:LIP-domain-containing protein [Xylariaceae sp. FL0255]
MTQSSENAGPEPKISIPPSQDPWYTASNDLEACGPGAVLKVRDVPSGLKAFKNASEGYHILYRTTDSQYKSTFAVTTLLLPKSPCFLNSGHKALLSYQAAYNSPNIDFGPSYRIFEPQPPNVFGTHTLHDNVDSMLSRGWFVAIPDFEGPRATLTATVMCGHAVLDGIRAILSHLSSTKSEVSVKYAMWGYSGGAIASEKAAELQVQYAPELTDNFVGAALGGLVSDVGKVFGEVNESGFSGNLVIGLLGLMNQYPELDSYIQSRLKVEGTQSGTNFLSGRNLDSIGAFQRYENQDIFGYFVGGRADLDEFPLLNKLRHVEWMLGYHGVPQIPLFVYSAIGDEMTPIAATDYLVAHYQQFGCSVLYERNTVGGHIAEIANGRDRALNWLIDAFHGFPTPSSNLFETRDVTIDLYKPPARLPRK